MEGDKEVPDVIHVKHISVMILVLVLVEEYFKAVSFHNPCVEQLLVVFHQLRISFSECRRNIVPEPRTVQILFIICGGIYVNFSQQYLMTAFMASISSIGWRMIVSLRDSIFLLIKH